MRNVQHRRVPRIARAIAGEVERSSRTSERERFRMPTFVRYALFAFAVMLPAHLVTTVALGWLDR
jgi:hypothetical protein